MDENVQEAQPQQPRLQQNPHLAECPDFDDESFNDLVLAMVGPNRTRDQAIDNLRTAWHTQNGRRKALWDAQVRADQEHQNDANAQIDANAQNVAVDEPDQAPIDAANIRRRPKLGAFAATTTIGDEITLKPSTFAINKLKDMKYVELYCFSPAGCRDHANYRLSTAEEAFSFTYGISPDGSSSNALTLKPASALAHPGKITPDEHLTWEQVRDAKACFLNHVIEAGWNRTHVNALVSFFINLDSHPYNDTPDGKQALVWYQAHARKDWHRKLGTPESYNLAILNKTLLADFKKKANDISVHNNVTQVSYPHPSHRTPLTSNLTTPPHALHRSSPRTPCSCTTQRAITRHTPHMRRHAPYTTHMCHHAPYTTHTCHHVP
jgi:hypothetical protein